MEPWTPPDYTEVQGKREMRKRQREFQNFRQDLTAGRTSNRFPDRDSEILNEDLQFENEHHFNLAKEIGKFEESTVDEVDGLVEPFNMRQERESGEMDAEGNNVKDAERKKVEKDAWVDSLFEQPVKKLKSAESSEAPERSLVADLSLLKSKLCRLMKDGETVSATLSRLKGTQPRPSNYKKNIRKSSINPNAELVSDSQKPEFAELVQIVGTLIGAGELEVHEWRKEELEHFWKVQTNQAVAGPYTSEQIRKFKLEGRDMKVMKVAKTGGKIQGEDWVELDTLQLDDIM